jgi:hypothetical protein
MSTSRLKIQRDLTVHHIAREKSNWLEIPHVKMTHTVPMDLL